MKHLQMPAGAGDKVITDQCSKVGWGGFLTRWLTAAAAYRAGRGDPWVMNPANFTPKEKQALSGLYELRRKNGPIKRIRRLPEGSLSCPMCGSPGGRSLDHALPKSEFPEFSILRENLVPACTICNSDEKGARYRGSKPPERPIHPYYDSWASDPIWQVEFGPDLDAVVFRAVPCVAMTVAWYPTVEYHLSQVLGEEWRESSRRYWGSLPLLIRNRAGAATTAKTTRREIACRLAEEIFSHGVNGWQPAFLRGVLNDVRLPKHLSDRVNALP